MTRMPDRNASADDEMQANRNGERDRDSRVDRAAPKNPTIAERKRRHAGLTFRQAVCLRRRRYLAATELNACSICAADR